MNNCIIYMATNIENKKSYIGQTIKSMEQRMKKHKRDSIHIDYAFYRSIRKYGWNKFKWKILYKNIPKCQLNNMEKWCISNYNTYNKGYNSTLGGDSNPVDNPETRLKISKALKGRKHSKKHRENNSKAQKRLRRKLSDEHKQKLSWTGKKHSKETRLKQSKSAMGRKHSEKSKCKMAITRGGNKYKIVSPNGIEYITKNGLTAFCKEHELCRGTMYFLLKNNRSSKRGWSIIKIF